MTERRRPRAQITERDFQTHVVHLAMMCQFEPYHPPDNKPTRTRFGRVVLQRVTPGWPDLILCRPPELLAVELKTDKGRVTNAQTEWLRRLEACGIETHIWRPRDWDTISTRLTRPRPGDNN